MPAARRPEPAIDPLTATTRRVDLDWIRILAFGVLVVYHVGMYYVTWDWHVKSAHASRAIEPLMKLVSPWRMDLIFVVSGAATAFMLAGRGASGALLAERARRLGVPLVFGMLVVVPPQSYLEVVQRLGYTGSFVDFMRAYLAGYSGFCRAPRQCLLLPTWNHLWYLPYLFVYTALVWSVVRAWPRVLERAAGAASRALAGAGLFAWPIAWLVLTHALLRASFPPTHALVDDAFLHAQYLAMFALGTLLPRMDALAARFEALRWPTTLAALLAWAAMLWLAPAPGAAATPPADAGRVIAYGTLQWCAIVAALGHARRHLAADGPWRRWLTDAVFPVYVLHQTITILLAAALAPAGLAPALEAPLLVAGTFAGALGGYALLRRVRWLRPAIGLKRDAAPPRSPWRASARHEAVSRMIA
ncbi:MAG: acyltransferase family protein [Burkholderiaceae bacterium]